MASADRYYAYAWGLAYWLTFQKRLLEGPSLERYVQRGNPAGGPAVRFQQLLAAPLESVEAQWRDYIVSLKVAVTAGRLPAGGQRIVFFRNVAAE